MAEDGRNTIWRQGDVLFNDAAISLRLYRGNEADNNAAVVVSHDCDLAASEQKEPSVEIIVGRKVDGLGADSYAKNARRLHIQYQTDSGPIVLQLSATDKRPVRKAQLFGSSPNSGVSLQPQFRTILQRWLASRYHRAAFPEQFEQRLRDARSGSSKSLLKHVEKLLTKGGQHIRALLFDLDRGCNVERESADDPYQLGIVVLFNSTDNPEVAQKVAAEIAEGLDELFGKAFCQAPGQWQGVEIIYCDAISDSVLTVAQQEKLKQWRLEHLSLRDDPTQSMLTPYT